MERIVERRRKEGRKKGITNRWNVGEARGGGKMNKREKIIILLSSGIISGKCL